jgi:hypothetical protein
MIKTDELRVSFLDEPALTLCGYEERGRLLLIMYCDDNPLLGFDNVRTQIVLSEEDLLHGFLSSICGSYVDSYIPGKRYSDYLLRGLGREENTQGEATKFIVLEKKKI